MIDGIENFMKKLPAIGRNTNPSLAAILGLVLGGVALGIYFRSFIDFVVPVGIAILLAVIIGDVGWIGGAVIASVWGFFRSQESNERIGHPAAGG